MDKADHPRLSSEAIDRIEHARTQLHGSLKCAESKQHLIERTQMGARIGIADYEAVLAAPDRAAKFYLSVMAYEYFLIDSSVSALEDDLVNLEEISAAEFHVDPAVFAGIRQHWLARASGRGKINAAEI